MNTQTTTTRPFFSPREMEAAKRAEDRAAARKARKA